jgi:hypothetical protein
MIEMTLKQWEEFRNAALVDGWTVRKYCDGSAWYDAGEIIERGIYKIARSQLPLAGHHYEQVKESIADGTYVLTVAARRAQGKLNNRTPLVYADFKRREGL